MPHLPGSPSSNCHARLTIEPPAKVLASVVGIAALGVSPSQNIVPQRKPKQDAAAAVPECLGLIAGGYIFIHVLAERITALPDMPAGGSHDWH